MRRVLVVDDKESNRELLRTALERAGYAVSEAADGEQALAMMLEKRPDLAIIDIQMPGLDGYGVLARVRSDERLAGIPIVALTAYAMESDSLKGWQAGFAEYITKPVPMRHLLKIVAESIGNR